MAMRPCSKCLENSWSYELPDAVTVRATCKLCGHEVEFSPAKLQCKEARAKAHVAPAAYSYDPAQDYSTPPW